MLTSAEIMGSHVLTFPDGNIKNINTFYSLSTLRHSLCRTVAPT